VCSAVQAWIPRIFEQSYRRLIPIEQAKYGSRAKNAACRRYFGDRSLGDLYKHVLVTAFNLNATVRGCSVLFSAVCVYINVRARVYLCVQVPVPVFVCTYL
jgi:hypothetical protein